MIRMRTRQLILIALLVAPLAACGMEPDRFASHPGEARSWAALPEEAPMPAAAPDDPRAYRGVRFRVAYQSGGPSVESGGRKVPWLGQLASAYTNAGGADGPFFGYQMVSDGRRRMVWFIRLVEPPTSSPTPPLPSLATTAPPPVATTAPPPRLGGEGPARPAAVQPPLPAPPTPAPVEPPPRPPDPLMAVLDVAVLPGDPESGLEMCGPDPVIIDGENGWRLNRNSGRIEPVDPAGVDCPDGD